MTRSVSEKMGVKPNTRAHIVGAPPGVITKLALPKLAITDELQGDYAYLHRFATTRAQMETQFPALRDHLLPDGMLWVSWPKGKQLGTDLSLPEVIRIGYNHGLVESKTIAVDTTWSALKFTHPRPGQRYNNSYGTLPEETPGIRGPVEGS